jgi:hypothetical protein
MMAENQTERLRNTRFESYRCANPLGCPCAQRIKHYAMKAYGGVDVWTHVFLTSALAGGEWSASRPCRFTAGERVPGTHWIGGRADPRAGLDDFGEKKILHPTGTRTPTPESSSP